MRFNPAVYDLWVFRRAEPGVEFLVLRASQMKADRHFNGGRFWQVVSGGFVDGIRFSTRSIASWRRMV